MGLDGGLGDEQVLGDLPVGQAAGGEVGDLPFGAGECVRTGEGGAAGPGAGGEELSPGLLGQGCRAGSLGEVKSAAQRIPGIAAPPGAPQVSAKVGEGECQLVPGGSGFQQAGRLGQGSSGMVSGSCRGVRPERGAAQATASGGEVASLKSRASLPSAAASSSFPSRRLIIERRPLACASMFMEPRVRAADSILVADVAGSLIAWQWPDGGWNCDPAAAGRRSSFHESLAPAW